MQGHGTLASLSSTQAKSKQLGLTSYTKLQKAEDVGKGADELWADLCKRCLNWIFSHDNVPCALVRVAVYAKYGPAIENPITSALQLRGSQKLLQPHEERVLLEEERRAIIVELYADAKDKDLSASIKRTIAPNNQAIVLPDSDFGAIDREKHPLVFDLMEVTRDEVSVLLNSVKYPTSDAKGDTPRRSTLSDCLSNALLKERARRIRSLQRGDPRLDEIRTDNNAVRERPFLLLALFSQQKRVRARTPALALPIGPAFLLVLQQSVD